MGAAHAAVSYPPGVARVSVGVWLAGLAVAWACAVVIVALVAVARVARGSRSMPRGRGRRPLGRTRPLRVLLVRPCAGDEPCLGQTLASIAWAHWSFDLSVRLTVADDDDAALPVARATAMGLRASGLDILAVATRSATPNRKAGQLSTVVDPLLSPTRAIDAVIVADSDIDLVGLNLDALVEPLFEPGTRVGARWCPPVEHGAERTVGDRISTAVLCGSMHAFPLLGRLDRAGLVGKTFAVRGDALRALGGFSSLVRHLGEDMELARRLRDRDWSVRMHEQVVRSRACDRSIREVFMRYVRWMLVLRAQRPRLLPSVALLLAATPLVLALVAATTRFAPVVAPFVLGVLVVARLGVARTAARSAGRAASLGRACLDAVIGDLFLLAAFMRALGPRRVRWRERDLRLGPGGLLEESSGDPIQGSARPCTDV
jgi:ceramide glucosyltransferase